MVVLLILAILLAIAIPTFLGTTGGANDRATQSNLNPALLALKAQAIQNSQSYSSITKAVMSTDEPSLTWNQSTTAAPITVNSQGPVDFYVAADGNGVVVVSYSKNSNTCWYAVDNLAAVVDTAGPYGATAVAAGNATQVPTAAGTYFSKALLNNVTTGATSCNPAKPPIGGSTWSGTFSAG